MATNSNNYTGVTYPDVGDQNNVASGQVSGDTTSWATAFEDHDHVPGRGTPVTSAGFAPDGPVNYAPNGPGKQFPIYNIHSVNFLPVDTSDPAQNGLLINLSLWVDAADNKLYFRDNTGTDKLVTTVPPQ